MKLELEKFKIIPTTYNAIDFMKIQYEDKDLVMKLKGEFLSPMQKIMVCVLCSLQMITQLLTKSLNWVDFKINQN